ncbi:unnamed protein product, partial [Meganyctiphanes norvegica]
MDKVSNRDCLLYLWQNRNLEIETAGAGEKADAMRFSLNQLQSLKETRNDTNDLITFGKEWELMHQYGQLMDKKDGGLNNCAQPILALVGNAKNDSKKWQCSIKADDLLRKMGTQNSLVTSLEPEYKKFANVLSNRNPQKPPLLNKQKENVQSQSSKDKPGENENLSASFNLLDDDMMEDETIFQNISAIFCNIFSQQYHHGLVTPGMSFNRESVHTPSGSRSNNHFPPFNSCQNQSDATHVTQTGERGGGYPYPWNRGGRGRSSSGAAAATEERMCNRSNNNQNMRGYAQRGRGTSAALGRSEEDSWNDNRFGNNYKNNRGQGRGQGTSQWGRKESLNDEANEPSPPHSSFKTASHQLALEQQKKFGNSGAVSGTSYGSGKRSLGLRRAPAVNSKFTPPIRKEDEDIGGDELVRKITPHGNSGNGTARSDVPEDSPYAELMMDERLKGIDVKMVELIMNEIMDIKLSVTWDDIAGLQLAKATIQEIVVWPMLRPDIFTGLRGPPKGLLLFGPPGTGKTMIGKCIASQSGSTFFSISASSLTSKWVGEGEKMVRALFAVARCHQPCVIFIDEIDSLLTQRSESEHESSRRIKTEFLVQLDGATCDSEDRMLVVGATNRPQELDEAARRRLVKRLYIPLPEASARQQIITNLLANQSHTLSGADMTKVCELTDGYSGADMANLCREAALGPIRSINFADIQSISVDQVRPINLEDFRNALYCIRASVSDKDLAGYENWNKQFGIS